jgi:hypothetical protein
MNKKIKEKVQENVKNIGALSILINSIKKIDVFGAFAKLINMHNKCF